MRCHWVFLLMFTAVANASETSAPEMSAEELAQQVYDRPAGDDISARVVMLLEKTGDKPKQRLLYSFSADRGNANRHGLMRFVEPANIAGTGLLTMNQPGDETDQWLYLPSLDRVRRIASNRKGGRFVGSDFFYEDLSDREVNMDKHRILGTDKVGKVSCTLLESTPVKSSNSVYSKRISCVHPKLLIPLRVDFYQRGDKPVKRLQASKIRKVQGYWTVFESTMTDLKKNHKTRLITTDLVYDQGLPDSLFSQRGLSDESLELPFRPQQ